MTQVLRKTTGMLIALSLVWAPGACKKTAKEGSATDGIKLGASAELVGIDDNEELTPSYLISYSNSFYYAPDDSEESISDEGIAVIKNQLSSRIAWLKELTAAMNAKNTNKAIELFKKEAELYTDLGAAIDGDYEKTEASASYGKQFYADIIDNEELSTYFFDGDRLITDTWGDYGSVYSEMANYLISPMAEDDTYADYAEDFALELESLEDAQAYLEKNGWENVFNVHFSGYMALVVTWYTQDYAGFEIPALESPSDTDEMITPADGTEDASLMLANVKAKKKKMIPKKKKTTKPVVKKTPSIKKKPASKPKSLAETPGVNKKKKAGKQLSQDEVTAKHLKNKSSKIRPSHRVKMSATKDIENKDNLLGQGAAGSVYKTKAKIGGDEVDVAAKVVRNSNMDSKQAKDLMSLQKKVGPHPNIIGTLDVKRDKKAGKTVIVSELGGDGLHKKSGQYADKKAASKEISGHMADSADGLAHMHKQGYIHGDIKPENVVMRGNGKAALIDWDGAKPMKKGYLTPNAKQINASEGSIISGVSDTYAAPELYSAKKDIIKGLPPPKKGDTLDTTKKQMADALAKKKIDGGKADVYSLGVTSSTQMIGFEKTSQFTKLKSNDEKNSFLTKEGVPGKFGKNIVDMTEQDPAKRPNMDEVAKRFRDLSVSGE